MSKLIGVSLICAILVIGLIINTKGFIGLFPIIASLSYSLLSWLCKTAVGVKWALILNLTLWAVHDLYVGLPIAFIVDCFIALVTLINIRRCRDELHSEGDV